MAATDSARWQKAMEDEIRVLGEYQTYDLVPAPEGRPIVGGRWVYAIKLGPNGEEEYRVRYVAKGYSGTHHICTHSHAAGCTI